jgi:hypothetical protein
MAADHRDMPRGQARAGEVPHPEVIMANSYALELERDRTAKPHAMTGYRFRFSDATKCARALGYDAQGIEPEDKPTAVDLAVMDQGSRGHDVVQRAFLERYWLRNATLTVTAGADDEPVRVTASWEYGDTTIQAEYIPYVDQHTHWGLIGHCEFEVKCEIPGVGTGHADVWCPQGVPGTHLEGRPTAFELKHSGGFAWKLQIGERGAAQGPRWSAKNQGALCGMALGAEVVVLATVATEVISKGLAKGKNIPEMHRGFGEWVYERDEWEPWALAEVARVKRILEVLDAGGLPPRALSDPQIPKKARVISPDQRGAWVLEVQGKTIEAGTYWGCEYCGHRPRCIADGPS